MKLTAIEKITKQALKQSECGSHCKPFYNLISYYAASPMCGISITTEYSVEAHKVMQKNSAEGTLSQEVVYNFINETKSKSNTTEPAYFLEALELTYNQSKTMRSNTYDIYLKEVKKMLTPAQIKARKASIKRQCELEIKFTVTSKEIKFCGLGGGEIANEHGCNLPVDYKKTITVEGAKQALALMKLLPAPNKLVVDRPFSFKHPDYCVVFV